MKQTLTLRDAIADLGWFWALFAAVVGGPSILSLLQMIFVEHRLIDALQWIVDGYNGIAAVLGALAEPLLAPAIAWLNGLFDWNLVLHPHWRPLFMLAALPVTSIARDAWRRESNAHASEPLALGVGAAIGVIAAGLAPLTGGWWAQGLIAAAPVAMFFLASELASIVRNLLARPINRDPPSGGWGLLLAAVAAALAFALGAGLSFAPALRNSAGLAALGALVVFLGAMGVASGLNEAAARTPEANANVEKTLRNAELSSVRVGLTMLGGFVTAAFILAADFGVKALS